ncbi:MAG: hypothetical protein JXR25_03605 [Pontiellaceae bacterium]|nr:hypothetical protein [Pontiellaceae bacterium]MBN2783887.1 hypothetical protein [Pontiellaceae bacterium]
MKNEITVDEARRVLGEIDATRMRARNLIFAEFAGIPLMLWGLIWAFCHLNGFYYMHLGRDLLDGDPDRSCSWVVWSGLTVTGIFVVAKLCYANPVRSKGSWIDRYRAPLLVPVWFAFHFLTAGLHTFRDGLQMSAYHSAYFMLMFIVFGLLLGSGLFFLVGVLISCWTLAGYYLLPEYYHLIMGVGAGGTLFVAGVVSLIRCRRGRSVEVEAGEGLDV